MEVSSSSSKSTSESKSPACRRRQLSTNSCKSSPSSSMEPPSAKQIGSTLVPRYEARNALQRSASTWLHFAADATGSTCIGSKMESWEEGGASSAITSALLSSGMPGWANDQLDLIHIHAADRQAAAIDG
eukprot:CAMPEP_0178439840 /NCGR_PEP_ID=MMETSP0689_2-20121128/36403_1 /TAXON_ID=160604 /ORGANISM="Amphidinium massartii, Strain CS-259" /LENGTH=129 /DNA_ID=CAMNT_0020062461 /DNA_START=135 /DNA_END=524 /DNA_ORIENTATION=+